MLNLNRRRVQVLSRALQGFCALAFLFTILGWIWIAGHASEFFQNFALQRGLLFDPQQLTLSTQILLAITLAAPLVPLCYGLWRLYRLFGLVAEGSYFSLETARHLYYFSLMIMASVVVGIITNSLASILLTMNNPPGLRSLSISFGSQQLTLLLLASAFTLISWILSEATRIARENAEII